MIITIDTSKDSEEDIRKAITFLSSITNKAFSSQQYSPQDYQQDNQQYEPSNDGSVFANLFDAPENSVGNLMPVQAPKKKEEPEKVPKVIAYGW